MFNRLVIAVALAILYWGAGCDSIHGVTRTIPLASVTSPDVVEQAIRAMAASGDSPPLGGFGGFGARLSLAGYAQAVQAEARKELIARGRDKKDVDAMPAVQAAFLHMFDTYRDLADDHRKWFLMPPSDALDGMAQAAARAKRVKADHPKDVLLNTFLLLLPAVEKVHLALLRTEPAESDDQRRLDVEREEQWCASFEAARERLERAGIHADVRWRVEPGEQRLPVARQRRTGRQPRARQRERDR